MCVFQCCELLSCFSAGGQWGWWRVLLRQTGRAQLWQENQRLVVPLVSSTRLSPPVSQQPLPSLWPFLSPLYLVDTQKHQDYPSLDVRLLLLTVSVFVPVTVRAGRFSHSCAKVRCLLRSTITIRHTVDILSPYFTCWARLSLVTFVGFFFCASLTLVHPVGCFPFFTLISCVFWLKITPFC